MAQSRFVTLSGLLLALALARSVFPTGSRRNSRCAELNRRTRGGSCPGRDHSIIVHPGAWNNTLARESDRQSQGAGADTSSRQQPPAGENSAGATP